MKKQKNKRFTVKSFLDGIREILVKSSLNLIVIIIFLAIAFLLGKAYLYRSDYFKLRRVEIKDTFLDQKSLAAIKYRIFNTYRAKNVFGLNLKGIAQSLQAAYPDAKDISVGLALPDKLVISLKLRKPVALVRAEKLYPVDEEGVILPIPDASSLKWVPSVDGVQITTGERKAKIIMSKNMRTTIDLLRDIKDIKSVAAYGVDSVDIRDPANISFYLKNGVEIRIGSDDFKGRLVVLAQTLRDPRLAMERIKYIDLRFGDAVIGPR